ncbi:hypothetical protein TRICI_002379 [Trichomonascus ciferrii]|uniref:Prokaryotic-type class I peptide chain release factors domain-containing protein n=1 Tax=Trichomonascus ciferrii TaxID=44093 RepID=A0A642V602_9ASCO|nr:hypothetical protein TRICI_002379 [Trichomonascus ciferrii]
MRPFKTVHMKKLIGYSFLRQYSSQSAKELENCRLWLSRLSPKTVPVDKFEVSFARSSGPGGQNVNKVNSKATIRMSRDVWDGLDWIPAYLKNQLKPGTFPYLTKKSGLVIQSDRTRNRHENLQDCYAKLCNAIQDSVYVESEPDKRDVEKWNEITKRTNQNRLETKKKVSQKKEARRSSRRDDY